MNTVAKHLTRITMIAAALCAGFSIQPAHAADNAVRVVQLPLVTVVAKRTQIVQLQRVVIIAKRTAPTGTLVAQRSTRAAAI